MSKSPKAAKPASKKANAAAIRYCSQPIQHPRQFDPAVDAMRARAIIHGGKKWVNGTQLTYYCYKAGDPVPAAWRGNTADIKAIGNAFQTWFKLGIGISFKEVSHPEDATIRIGFDAQDGSWSYVGRDILNIRDPLARTMNFGWALDTPYGRDTALHDANQSGVFSDGTARSHLPRHALQTQLWHSSKLAVSLPRSSSVRSTGERGRAHASRDRTRGKRVHRRECEMSCGAVRAAGVGRATDANLGGS